MKTVIDMRHPAPFILFIITGFLAVMWPLIRPEDDTWAYATGLAISLLVYLAWMILVIRDKFKNDNGDNDDSTSDFYKYGATARDNAPGDNAGGDGGMLPDRILPRTARLAEGARDKAPDISTGSGDGGTRADSNAKPEARPKGGSGGGKKNSRKLGKAGRGDAKLPPKGEREHLTT